MNLIVVSRGSKIYSAVKLKIIELVKVPTANTKQTIMKHVRVNEQNKYHHFQESPQATTVLVVTTWPHKNHNNNHFWKTADYMTEQNT